MDLYEIRGGKLDVITEEAENQDLSRESNTMEPYKVASARGGRATRDISTLQRFSVGTNESLRFERCEDSPPSPTGAEDGLDDDDDDDDVFREGETESEIVMTRNHLQGKVAEMENFAGHLEEIFLTVEENFGRREQHLEQHYNDVLQTLSQRYDERAAGLEEEKKSKLEALYRQLLACGQALDASKELIETAQEIYRSRDKRLFLKTVMPTIKRSAPSAPVINPQMPNSATQTSLRVCWSLFSDDTVEYYELYYRPVLEDMPADSTCAPHESKVKVKETHCTVTDLLPNAQYELWVTATNTTGISPASEKALYMTVPSPPVIKQRECTSCPEAALIRWESGNTNPVDSYNVELSEMGTDGTESGVTESIVAVPTCQCLIQLQTGRRYLISVRAVNIGGPSDRSDVIIVSTTGTFFHLLEETAHPCLSISEDGFTMFYGDEELSISAMAFDDNTFTRCVAVLGDLIPVRGRHYWEVEVDDGTEFRIGVAYVDTERSSYLGANNTSWCMRHILTPTRHKYEFLHNGWSPDLRITVNPVRIGVALDYERGTLSFFNVDLEQHLHTFHCHFQSYVHPCFGLDNPGALTVHNSIEAPEYTFT
ncbi:fibronectin type III and SPRY domain-containing protein 2 [Seriola lalandi dorsalis]|uniref:fibronectin type III and SPRY domain-containing protein 2 n=1 Tax=Seriola lalandi dorsalis TaxID=1841481 RepID=UPI000C6FBF66|nr:fibronectin type III and SPRY domain-containing protein 2 [Seriola lalandi dorsalis]